MERHVLSREHCPFHVQYITYNGANTRFQKQQDVLRKDMNTGFLSINEKLDRLLAMP
nr:hypothetical protein [Candidatus Sigynarchaeum springense]